MKKVIASLILGITTSVNAQSFRLLDDIDALRQTDTAVIGYAANRCGAVYLVMGKIGEGVLGMTKEKSMEFYEAGGTMLTISSTLDYEKSLRVRPGFYKNSEESSSANAKFIGEMAEIYLKDLKQNKIRTGNIFVGDFAKDLEYCYRFLRVVKEQRKPAG